MSGPRCRSSEMTGASNGEARALRSALVELIQPVVEDRGAILVDIELGGSNHFHIVRVLVHKDPGITVKACVGISREVGDLLDIEDPLPGRYRLEVTSPGLDRPLVTDGDFQRAHGRKVKVVLTSGKAVIGRLESWESDGIQVSDKAGAKVIPRREIAKAHIEVEFRTGAHDQ